MYNSLMKKLVLILVCFLLFTIYPVPGQAQAVPPIVSIRGEFEPFARETKTLDVYVVPLTGADCIILRCDEAWMLVDMGSQDDFERVMTVLDSLGVEKISIAFNTHPHSDHIGGMPLMLEQLSVERFVTTFPLDYAGQGIRQQAVVQALNKAGVPIEMMGDGSSFSLGGAVFQVMKVNDRDTNTASAVLRVRFLTATLLLTADIDSRAQNILSTRYDVKADIMKYPHHGLEPLNGQFLGEVDPAFVFFTHNSSDTNAAWALLDRHDIPSMFAAWGVIHMQSDGERWIVDQKLTREVRPNGVYLDTE